MAKQRRGAGRRPSGGAVAGRLVGAFLAGAAVMGGGLYLLQHTRSVGGRHGGAVATAPGIPGDGGSTASPEVGAGARPQAGAPATSGGEGAGNAAATGAVPQPPFGESEEVFETGARVYAAQCAACHGRPGKAVGTAGQFWAGGDAARSVAAEPAGVIFTQIAGGVAPGMPAYRGQLRETEIWDLALLLRNAGQELPDPVMKILGHGALKR